MDKHKGKMRTQLQNLFILCVYIGTSNSNCVKSIRSRSSVALYCMLFVIFSCAQQIGDFLFRCRPDSRGVIPMCFSTVRTAVGHTICLKAVVAGITKIVVQVFSPRSISVSGLTKQISSITILRRVCVIHIVHRVVPIFLRGIHIIHQITVDGDNPVKVYGLV